MVQGGCSAGPYPCSPERSPFYVVGMTGYAYLKKVFDGELLMASGVATAQSNCFTALCVSVGTALVLSAQCT